ncbi:hypothetical protein A2U01_0108188, partial [Trifolium medium]|nr:hypothetical protein [Trifolium medium]
PVVGRQSGGDTTTHINGCRWRQVNDGAMVLQHSDADTCLELSFMVHLVDLHRQS